MLFGRPKGTGKKAKAAKKKKKHECTAFIIVEYKKIKDAVSLKAHVYGKKGALYNKALLNHLSSKLLLLSD